MIPFPKTIAFVSHHSYFRTSNQLSRQKRSIKHDANESTACPHDTRENLTWCAYHNAHPIIRQEVVAVSAKTQLDLSVVPSRMMLSRVLNNYVSDSDLNPARKSNHRITSTELDERLLLAIRHCVQYKMPVVNSATIRAKADKVRRELFISTPG